MMQKIAAEMNISETAFIRTLKEGDTFESGKYDTVNVEIFAQYIFSCISRSVLGARKYDVSEKMNH